LSLVSQLTVRDTGRVIRGLIFFVFFYLYLLFVVDMRLIYQSNGVIADYPVFFRGWAFFEQTTAHPGGLAEYVSGFLSELLYYSWAGALVITVLAWLLCIATKAIISSIGLRRFGGAGYISPIILLILYNQYTHYFVTMVAALTAVFFAWIYLKTKSIKKLPDLAVFGVLSVVLYAAVGAGYFVFAALCVLYELLFEHHWKRTLLYLLLAAALAYVEGVLVFGDSLVNAYSNLLPYSWKIAMAQATKPTLPIAGIFCVITPLIVFMGWLWQILVKKTAVFTGNAIHNGFLWYDGRRVLKWAVESVLLFSVTGAALFYSYSSQLKTLFEVDYHTCYKQWDKVLKASEGFPNSIFVIHAINKALYHTGRLGSEMFAYPQHYETLFLSSEEENALKGWKKIDTYLELGLINQAEIDLANTMARVGPRAVLLKRMALINMVKGNTAEAKVYLGLLSRTITHSRWAKKYIEQLKQDPELSEDWDIQHLRSIKSEQDSAFLMFECDRLLLELLEKNPQNQMAFEYLMAWYLLSKQLDKIVLNIGRLKEFNYAAIPPLYEEAVLLYIMGRKENVELYGYQISTESRRRVKGFFDIYNRHMGNIRTAFNELAVNYGNSFLFYHLYGISGQQQ